MSEPSLRMKALPAVLPRPPPTSAADAAQDSTHCHPNRVQAEASNDSVRLSWIS
jgi:hypothetical protein